MPLREEELLYEPWEPCPDVEHPPMPIKVMFPTKPTKLSPSKADLRQRALEEIERRKDWAVSPLFLTMSGHHDPKSKDFPLFDLSEIISEQEVNICIKIAKNEDEIEVAELWDKAKLTLKSLQA